jgi:hypothetical protein
VAQPRRHPEGLADGEEPDGDGDDLDPPVLQLRDAEGEAGLPGQLVAPDQPEGQPQEEADQSPDQGIAQDRRHRHEGEHDQRHVLGRPELQAHVDQHRRQESQPQGADRARDEGADGGRRQRRRAAAAFGHQVAFEGGDDRGRLAGGVEQDRGGRAAVHPRSRRT